MPAVNARAAIRRATVDDAPTIARHRAAMFVEMGSLVPAAAPPLVDAATAWLREALPRGEYVGWLVTLDDGQGGVVAGAGVQLRALMPRPSSDGHGLLTGRQAIVLNVYVEPGGRRQGLARMLVRHILDWARQERIASLVLHASDAGRPLYESLGFVATNEMRFAGSLEPGGAPAPGE
jgi:GNAT superfamily N-acetyltransferase